MHRALRTSSGLMLALAVGGCAAAGDYAVALVLIAHGWMKIFVMGHDGMTGVFARA